MVWWTKPKDIQEPTKLIGEEPDSVAALFTILSPLGFVPRPPGRLMREKLRWMPAEPNIKWHLRPVTTPVGSYELREVIEPYYSDDRR